MYIYGIYGILHFQGIHIHLTFSLSIHPSSGHVDCFHVVAIADNATTKTGVRISQEANMSSGPNFMLNNLLLVKSPACSKWYRQRPEGLGDGP